MARATEKVDFERGRTRTGQALLMNGVDHVEPHTGDPDAHRAAVGDSRPARDAFDAARLRRRRQDARSRRERPRARDHRRRAAQRHRLRQPAAGRAVGARLPEAAERARPDAARVVRRAALGVRVAPRTLARRAPRTSHRVSYPAGQLRHAWKTLLQNHPHDSICGCSIDAVHEENMTRFARARQVGDAVVELALDAIADSVPAPPSPGVIRAVVVNTDAVERAQVVEAFIDLPVDSAEPWRKRRRAGARSAGRLLAARSDDHRASPARMASASSSRFSARRALVTHVMSRYETPWALNVRRLHLLWWAPALPPCGYAAFDLTPSAPADAQRCAGRPTARQRRRASSPRTSGSRSSDQPRRHVRGERQGDRRHLSPRRGARGRRRRRRRVQLLAARIGSPHHQRGRARDRRSRASAAVRCARGCASSSSCRCRARPARDRTQPRDRDGRRCR